MINRLWRKLVTLHNGARFRHDLTMFKRMPGAQRFPTRWEDRRPIYEDTGETRFDTHYVYHPAWAARILARTRPSSHVDIASKIDFSTMISAFMPVKFYDYRPAHISLSNLTSEKADLLNLPFADESIPSLSCMHVVEHVGLGRYGDPIDPNGDLKAIHELKRVTAVGGNLLFVVPLGKPRLVFNAHRIYSYSQVVEQFEEFRLEDFFLIPDNALKTGPIEQATEEDAGRQRYGCGCFWFIKNAPR